MAKVYKVKPEIVGTGTVVYYNRPEADGAMVACNLDFASQEELQMIMAHGDHPMIVEDKKASVKE